MTCNFAIESCKVCGDYLNADMATFCSECRELVDKEASMHEWSHRGACYICGTPDIGVNSERVCSGCYTMMEESNIIAMELYVEGQRYVYELADWRPDDTNEDEIERGLKDLSNAS